MKMKKQKILFVLLVFLILLINFVYAEILLSDGGVKYENRILQEFDKTSGFVDLIIYLKDISQAESLISNFSENEIGRVINRNISNRITAQMTEEAFFKLIQDERVESVYYNAPVQTLDRSAKNSKPLLVVGLIIFLIIVLFLIIHRKRISK